MESDTTHPLGIYGKSKEEGEQALLASKKTTYILRTAWLYGLSTGARADAHADAAVHKLPREAVRYIGRTIQNVRDARLDEFIFVARGPVAGPVEVRAHDLEGVVHPVC